jgi:hypothetical protein
MRDTLKAGKTPRPLSLSPAWAKNIRRWSSASPGSNYRQPRYSHPQVNRLGKEENKTEIQRTDDAVMKITGQTPTSTRRPTRVERHILAAAWEL